MRFFDREEELAYLRSEREMSRKNARFTVVSGRRRVGKTQLIHHAMGDEAYLYFLITRRAETDQCADFLTKIKAQFPISVYGTGIRFGELFRILMEESTRHPFTLVIDEFQELWKIDEGILGEIQEHWDRYHSNSQMNLIVCGSVNTLMNKIFFDEGQPLYGRSTSRLHLEPFTVPTLKMILREYNPSFSQDDLLALWTFTGGVARYVEELMDRGDCTKDKMIAGLMREHSFFFDEGKSVLVQEFGKEFGTYFSILSAIAHGQTSRNAIMQTVGTSVSGYLTNLEEKYGLISKQQPVYELTRNKACRYQLADNFCAFWFRFIFRNSDLIELKRYDVLQALLQRDYDVFSGKALETYFRQRFICEKKYTHLGGWWDRKGQNEIDLVGEDSIGQCMDFYEVKRNPEKYSQAILEKKVESFLRQNPVFRNYTHQCKCLSLKDM